MMFIAGCQSARLRLQLASVGWGVDGKAFRPDLDSTDATRPPTHSIEWQQRQVTSLSVNGARLGETGLGAARERAVSSDGCGCHESRLGWRPLTSSITD